MSAAGIFFIGVFTFILLVIFVYFSYIEMKKAGAQGERGVLSDLATRTSGPMHVLVATDGSPCSDLAVQRAAERQWPAGTRVEVVTIVHTNVPPVPDPALAFVAARQDDLHEQRRRAPEHLRRAERCLTTAGVPVSSRILEGSPARVIIDEAQRLGSDLIIVGSHGYGPVRRHLIGSVSQEVAQHAPCSVEIVKCAHLEAGVAADAGAGAHAASSTPH